LVVEEELEFLYLELEVVLDHEREQVHINSH
jgi:hypothetical protein